MKNKKPPRVYIVISCSGIGGTEKRFIELWNFMNEKGVENISIVMTSELYNIVRKSAYL
jgi:hypothetical protein